MPKIVSELPEFKDVESRLLRMENEWNRLSVTKKRLEDKLKEIENELEVIQMEAISPQLLPEESSLRQEYSRKIDLKNRITSRIQYIENKIKAFLRELSWEILFLEDILKNYLSTEKALEKFGKTDCTYILSGWVPLAQIEDVRRKLDHKCEVAIFRARHPQEDESPPVKLQNPSFLKPFEALTTSYGYPSYDGIDPTPFVALTFTIMFGIMFADIGYGLSLFFISLGVFLATTRRDKIMRSLNFILMYAGLSSIFFGFLFGEFFGGIVAIEAKRELIGDIASLFLLSLTLGFAHITLSLLSRISTEYREKKAIYPFSLLLIMISAIPLYLGYIPVGSGLILLGLGSLYYIKRMEFFEEILALLANILSYVRVGALAVMHITISQLFANVVLSLPGNVVGVMIAIVLFFIGTAVILASGTFLVFLHSLRLHWVEFFRRFYSGRGTEYSPFSKERRFIYEI